MLCMQQKEEEEEEQRNNYAENDGFVQVSRVQ